MTLLAVLSLYIAVLAVVPPGSAGPACARKNYQSQQCIERCKGKWGYPGFVMGSDAWGSVIQPSAVSAASWDNMVSKACGMQSSSSSSATPVNVPAGAIGNDPPSTNLPVATTTQTTSSSTTIRSSSTAVSSTVSSSSLSSSAPVETSSSSSFSFGFSFGDTPSTQNFAPQSSAEPTTSSPPPPPTTSSTPPPPETTSTIPPPPPPKTSSPPPEVTPTQSPDPSNNSGATSDSDIQAYLSAHNSVRAQHGASPLSWSDEAAGKAQQWANNCVFEHSGGKLGAFGENLAAGTGGSYGIAEAIKSWTDEVSSYDPNNPQPSHFTQVVWKASTQVGCAVQSCDGIFDASFGKAKFFVCEYTPQGNVIGQFG
ncbi:PR-1-like protein [Dendrothele bispora CBS 962.96]|uniref:PR-1-like protein n=1 Tax=Dendrothele bispora (strain CBS 962.96) TaxID=1314807 RepID=A0A4V4HFG1_DENBC|nr:PR-1-like protein [Dendrothele bispora CBS 962.96]